MTLTHDRAAGSYDHKRGSPPTRFPMTRAMDTGEVSDALPTDALAAGTGRCRVSPCLAHALSLLGSISRAVRSQPFLSTFLSSLCLHCIPRLHSIALVMTFGSRSRRGMKRSVYRPARRAPLASARAVDCGNRRPRRPRDGRCR